MPVKRPKHRGLFQNASCARSYARGSYALSPLTCAATPAAEILNPILHRKKLRLMGKVTHPESDIQKGNGGLGLYLRCVRQGCSVHLNYNDRVDMRVNLTFSQITTLSASVAACCEPNYQLE